MADTRIDELRRRLERDPGSRLFAQLAEELRKSGELTEAIRVARAGLAVNPAYPSARLTLGRALLDFGDATSARVELESALRDAPDNIQASRHLAQAREQLGDLKGAAEQYRRTLLMSPDDRQVQTALASVEARLQVPSSVTSPLAETTPPVSRRDPPPLPARAATVADGAASPAQGPPPASASPEQAWAEGGVLPPTLRIHAYQTGAGAPPAPTPPAPPPPPRVMAPTLTATLPQAPSAQARADEAPADGPSASTTPFSSSTLAELYFQQGLVERAADVYRQLLEQEPDNGRARQRLAELERAVPVADERAARRRSLERTIAGLEALLRAVQRR